MNAFQRSWLITKLSFNVIKQDKELLLFPICAGIFSLMFIAAMVLPSILVMVGSAFHLDFLQYILLFIIYFGISVIATFFNVCVVYTTKIRLDGGNATFTQSIKFAFSRIHQIVLWSLVSATVGLILRILDNIAEKMGQAGEVIMSILNSILGMIWSMITIFVIPGMVYNDIGPIDAIKKSVETLKKTWGESLIRYFGLGFVEAILIIIGIIGGIILLAISLLVGAWMLILSAILLVVYFLAVILLFSLANTIFNVALFVYADSGKVPSGFSKEIMQNAFQKKIKN